MLYITAVHLVGGSGHEHIEELQWRDSVDGQMGTSPRSILVEWVRRPRNQARVADAHGEVRVYVVEAQRPYLRTQADGQWTDNLLALPRY